MTVAEFSAEPGRATDNRGAGRGMSLINFRPATQVEPIEAPT
jgi:hypothetical protein